MGAGEEDASVVVCCIAQLHSFSSQGLFFQIPHEQSAAQPFFTLSVTLAETIFQCHDGHVFPLITTQIDG